MTPGNTRCPANCTGGPSSCFKAQLEAVHYQQPPWSTRFPELVDIFAEGDPCVPVDNDISDNTYCHQGSLNKTGPLGFTNVDADTVRSWMSTMSNVSSTIILWPVHCRRLKQRGVCRTAGAVTRRKTSTDGTFSFSGWAELKSSDAAYGQGQSVGLQALVWHGADQGASTHGFAGSWCPS